jgi:uncharacterized membrane protein YedE/YeeE
MEHFTPVPALIGGLLGGLIPPERGQVGWRLAFLAGMFIAPLAHVAFGGVLPTVVLDASLPVLALAGLIVGFGTRLGAGCTSGHGVCGIGRGSPRSLAATAVFMVTAIATVLVTHHVVGT